MEATFVDGLRVDIQVKLQQLELMGLARTMRATQKIEDKQAMMGAYRVRLTPRWSKPTSVSPLEGQCVSHTTTVTTVPRGTHQLPPINYVVSSHSIFYNPHTSPTTSSSPRPISPPFRKLAEKEMQTRRVTGLCFRYDKRFSPRHRCKQKTLQVLWVMDEEDEEENTMVPKQNQIEEEYVDGPTSAVLCVSFLVGFCAPQSMKVHGTMLSREVTILIDSRASHNFIVKSLITYLQLRCTPTQEFDVHMGNGDEIKGSRVCRGLRLQLAKITVVVDFFPLKLGASDIVLGFQWLATLGDSVMT